MATIWPPLAVVALIGACEIGNVSNYDDRLAVRSKALLWASWLTRGFLVFHAAAYWYDYGFLGLLAACLLAIPIAWTGVMAIAIAYRKNWSLWPLFIVQLLSCALLATFVSWFGTWPHLVV